VPIVHHYDVIIIVIVGSLSVRGTSKSIRLSRSRPLSPALASRSIMRGRDQSSEPAAVACSAADRLSAIVPLSRRRSRSPPRLSFNNGVCLFIAYMNFARGRCGAVRPHAIIHYNCTKIIRYHRRADIRIMAVY